MNLIQNNPFRAVGILANATEREIQRNKAKIRAYTKVGKALTFDVDFSILDSIDRSESSINQAFSNLEQNQSKLNHSIFWFLKTNPFDETAIAYMTQGNIEKALFIWDKITANKEVTRKNYSSFNNLGTIQLLSKTKRQIQNGIETKLKLIESPAFKEFTQLVADETHVVNQEKQSNLFIDQILEEIKGQFSDNETIELFENCSRNTQKYVSQKYSDTHIHSIENHIELTKRKRREDVGNAYENGVQLFTQSKNNLTQLKSLLGTQDLKYKLLADSLAKEVMQCGIDYFKHWKENRDPSDQSIKLLSYAKSIAVSTQVRDRVKDNIEGIEEWKETALIENDLIFIGNKLEGFQKLRDSIDNADALVKSCKPKLKNIKNIVGGSDELYLQLSSGVANNALGMLIDVVNNAQKGMEYDKSKILSLPRIVSSTLAVTETIGTLDMESQMRRRYNENLSAIRNLSRQLEPIRTSKQQQQQVSTTTNDDDINWFQIIGWGAAALFFIRACNS